MFIDRTSLRPASRGINATPRAAKIAAALALFTECLRVVESEEGDEADAHRATYLAARNELLSLLGIDEFEVARDRRGMAIGIRTHGLTLTV